MSLKDQYGAGLVISLWHHWKLVEPSRDEPYWKEVRSLGAGTERGLGGPAPSSLSSLPCHHKMGSFLNYTIQSDVWCLNRPKSNGAIQPE